jgi:tetratricopeptide (TPR) repeat protein
MLEEYINNRIKEAYDFMQNDTEESLKIFDEVLEIEPDNIDAINGKGSSLMKLNRFDEADQYFDHSLSISANSSAFLNKGLISKHEDDVENAVKFYDMALDSNPDLENIVNLLKSEIMEEDSSDSESYDFNDQANELIQQGIEFKNQKKLWDSLDSFMKAIEADPECRDDVCCLIDEIKCIFQNEFLYNDYEFNDDSKIDRLKMQALRALVDENNPKKALTLMDIVLELDENDINTLNHKGGVLFICDEYEKAVECFDGCLQIDENYSYALFNKALVLRIMNRLTEALECFDELLKTPENYNKVKPYQLEILDKLHEEATT